MREKRPYLRGDVRRRQLLDATAALIVDEGLPALTMAAVAERAGVSRRLVYDHFADLGALYEAFYEDRSSAYLALLDDVHDRHLDREGTIRAAWEVLLAIPPADLRIVRLLILDGSTPRLSDTRSRLQDRLVEKWQRFVPDHVDDDATRALTWAVLNSLLGLAEMVSRGELEHGAAVTMGIVIASSTVDAVAATVEFGTRPDATSTA